jgi:hypothetical protein
MDDHGRVVNVEERHDSLVLTMQMEDLSLMMLSTRHTIVLPADQPTHWFLLDGGSQP